MIIIRSRRSVEDFYRAALRAGTGTAERLDAPVADRFAAFLNALHPDTPRTALELGYGMGIYATTLARLGFRVTAVDQIPPEILRDRLAGSPGLSGRITIVQQRLESYCTSGDFGVLVAKDVLHYIEQDRVYELLSGCAHQAPGGAGHYLEVFTDIERTDRSGHNVLIDGEAAYTAGSFQAAVCDIYRDWNVHWIQSPHSETNTGHPAGATASRKYFQANKITVIATRSTNRGGNR